MPWWNWVLFSVSMIILLSCAWRFIAIHLTSRKRLELIHRWSIAGDGQLAMDEFDAVDFKEHLNAIFWLRNPENLYGPLIQGVWDIDLQRTYPDFWWKCYNEIYLKAPKSTQRTINKFVSAYGLPGILTTLGYDLDYLLLAAAPPPKFSMVDGAEEYEQIMAMQEMGL